MVWKIEITKTAASQIKKLDKLIQKRIIAFLRKIEDSTNPRLQGKALRGDKEELWRYRIGDYRLICRIEDKLLTVFILSAGHRKDIYQ